MLLRMKVLLIEDEPAITRMIERGLRPHGYDLIAITAGNDPTIGVVLEDVELVLLDIQLPGKNGIAVLSDIRRQRADLPVIMLTAQDDVQSKVSALDIGADDYVAKPFAFEELIARMRAVTRRADQRSSSVLEFGDLRLDLLAHRVTGKGEVLDLSRREYSLLEYFARNPGRVLSRQQILMAVWEYDFEGESNVVDVYVRYLRNKLGRIGMADILTTVRGSGYRFDPR